VDDVRRGRAVAQVGPELARHHPTAAIPVIRVGYVGIHRSGSNPIDSRRAAVGYAWNEG